MRALFHGDPLCGARPGCTVIAIERDGELTIDWPADVVLTPRDALYVCGTPETFTRLYDEFAESAAAER